MGAAPTVSGGPARFQMAVPREERDGALAAEPTIERWRVAVVALATLAALPLFVLENPASTGALTGVADAADAPARALTAVATADRSFDVTPLVERAEHWHDARATMAIILRLDSAAAEHEAEAIALAREVADFEYARHQRIATSIAELRKERERQRLLDEEDARRARAKTTSGPTTTIAATPPIEEGPSDIQWEALRYCEATGNYGAVSPTGKYRGAYQFSVETWDWIAGLYYEHLIGLDPAEARGVDQDRMARALYDLRGRGQWPVCGRYLP